jgi:hypothetical protein
MAQLRIHAAGLQEATPFDNGLVAWLINYLV